jgi:hypothetical protein
MLGQEGKNLLGAVNSQAVAWIEFLTRLVLWILNCIAVNVFTLTRSQFGERFMTVVNWAFGALMMSTFMTVSLFADGPQSGLLRKLWAPTVLICFLYHRWVIRKRNKGGVEWYSYAPGIPHLLRIPAVRRFITPEMIEKWGEPAALLVVSYLIRFIDRGFGIMLAIVAVLLSLRAYVVYYLEREEYLDRRDARIISEYANEVLEGRSASETAGFTIAASNRELILQEQRLASRGQRSLPASINDMLDPPAQGAA